MTPRRHCDQSRHAHGIPRAARHLIGAGALDQAQPLLTSLQKLKPDLAREARLDADITKRGHARPKATAS